MGMEHGSLEYEENKGRGGEAVKRNAETGLRGGATFMLTVLPQGRAPPTFVLAPHSPQPQQLHFINPICIGCVVYP